MTVHEHDQPPRPDDDAFFVQVGNGFEPRPHARSPWSTTMVHGRHLSGLAARAAEKACADPEFQPARLTIDLFRSAPMSVLSVHTSVRRHGGRVRVVEVSITDGRNEVAWASVQFLRRSVNPEGEVWAALRWQVPAPAEIQATPPPYRSMGEFRRINHGHGPGLVRKQLWYRETHALVEGEVASPFTRLGWAADLVSPIVNAGTHGLGYINADISLYASRLPSTGWIGFEANGHSATAGVSVGQCALYDERGTIGYVVTSALKKDGFNPSVHASKATKNLAVKEMT